MKNLCYYLNTMNIKKVTVQKKSQYLEISGPPGVSFARLLPGGAH
jgi:hypothetical protein